MELHIVVVVSSVFSVAPLLLFPGEAGTLTD
jgi:hypothetical protein